MSANNDHRQTWPASPEPHFDEDEAAEEFLRGQYREANSFATSLVDLTKMHNEYRSCPIPFKGGAPSRSKMDHLFPLHAFQAGGNSGGDCTYLGNRVIDGLWYVAALMPDDSELCVSAVGFPHEYEADRLIAVAADSLKARAEREWEART